MDFKTLVESLAKNTPSWAIAVAVIGVVWQVVYAVIQEWIRYRQTRASLDLELNKFEQQSKLDQERFNNQKVLADYELRKWREQLSVQLTTKHFDARLSEYAELWAVVETAAKHRFDAGEFDPEQFKGAASSVRKWRYSKGGLLAEETTRDAAYAFQTALWGFNGSAEAYRQLRFARRLLRSSLRADLGLGEDDLGQSILDATERRHKIRQELKTLQPKED
ncbi:hypothetical protein VOI32_35895 [Paraburkholderia caribensis]|uniref:Uncharacterized protein n=2 Tax=Paraburkholderia TaxID=1822464 RepID=B2JXH6_PARP8|nr:MULTISPECIES: hypothetical protein [Paraburkholderia]ACC76334.1 hypothetical protein Bphy_7349 [Paraburkholderia phymatum STM815]MCO4881792.1 hypothetical protein [Paraburkholderia caribensis]PTB23136.1 hypothetical protein C9I56_40830 [Paraburkholderia caribensis]